MACKNDGKVISFFSKLIKCTPFPICWTPRAELPKKRAKRGPGRPRKIRKDEIKVIEIDQESGEPDGEICTGEGVLPLAKTEHTYTLHQKKRVVVIVRKEPLPQLANTARSILQASTGGWRAAISKMSVLKEEIGGVKADGWIMIKLLRMSCSHGFSNLVTSISQSAR